LYASLRKEWRSRDDRAEALSIERMTQWRRQGAVFRVSRPLRLDRARRMGYRAKQGYVVVRVRVRRGGFSKPRPRSGRRQKALGVVKHKVNVSVKREALGRALRRFPNLSPLGAYWLAEDGRNMWFDVLMVDRSAIKESRKW